MIRKCVFLCVVSFSSYSIFAMEEYRGGDRKIGFDDIDNTFLSYVQAANAKKKTDKVKACSISKYAVNVNIDAAEQKRILDQGYKKVEVEGNAILEKILEATDDNNMLPVQEGEDFSEPFTFEANGEMYEVSTIFQHAKCSTFAQYTLKWENGAWVRKTLRLVRVYWN